MVVLHFIAPRPPHVSNGIWGRILPNYLFGHCPNNDFWILSQMRIYFGPPKRGEPFLLQTVGLCWQSNRWESPKTTVGMENINNGWLNLDNGHMEIIWIFKKSFELFETGILNITIHQISHFLWMAHSFLFYLLCCQIYEYLTATAPSITFGTIQPCQNFSDLPSQKTLQYTFNVNDGPGLWRQSSTKFSETHLLDTLFFLVDTTILDDILFWFFWAIVFIFNRCGASSTGLLLMLLGWTICNYWVPSLPTEPVCLSE